MAEEQHSAATTGEWAQTHKPIVVAVDGSERNRSAVKWAAGEAAAVGCQVVLVTAVEDHPVHLPHFSVRGRDQQVRDMLADAREGVRHLVSEQSIDTYVDAGSPVEVLLRRSADARMLVVGKRGLGGFARLLVGSTSIAVAGRAKVPVAIVPDAWNQEEHKNAPVVLGIDPARPEHNPIHLAFSRAQRLGVPLIAVRGREVPTAYSWDAVAMATAISEWEQASDTEFGRIVDLWRDRFADVEVQAVHSPSHPAMAVLEAAENAQLVILGRHTDSKLGGFAFGSVTRAVLHYSTCPVIVVPTEEQTG